MNKEAKTEIRMKKMYNYQILTKYSKAEIFEKLSEYLINSFTDEAEETAIHLLWLFKEMDKSTMWYFFREEREKEINNVQLPNTEKHE